MAKDFKAKQLRTTQIIASGSSVGSVPSLLIYSASDATDVDGSYTAAMTSNVGIDVWMFVSGAKNDTGLANDNHSGKVLFAGDVVVSGTLYAEKQIMEVDLSQNSDLFLSGAVILGDQGAAPDGNGQLRLYQSIGANSGSIFVSTGSIYLGANSGGSYSETEITPKIYQADNGIGSQVISSTNTSLHLDINELTGSLTNSTIASGDLFAVADVDATNSEVKKISLTNVAAKLAGDGITATTGVLAATALNGINVSSSGIELSLTDISGSSSIATGDSMVFLDTDGSTQITTVAQLVTALAGNGLTNSGNQFQANVDGSTISISGGNLIVKSSGITETQLNTSVAGTGLSGGGGTALSIDLNELPDLAVDVSVDSIAVIESGTNTSSKESIADLVSGIAGSTSSTGLSASSGVLSVNINSVTSDAGGGDLADSILISDNSDSNNNKKITLTQLKALIDTDTTYTAGDGIDLTGTEFSLDLKPSGGLNIDTAELEIDTNIVQKIIYAVTGSGTHGFGTGDAVSASGTDSFAIGRRSVASGNYSVAIGASQSTNSNTASGLSAAALGGDNATASGDYSAVLGGTGNTASGDYSAVLGRSSTAAGIDSIAIGKSLTATEDNSIAIGNIDNNAKIALSGSVEVFSTTVLNGDTTVSEGSDLLVSGYVKHLSDTDTSIQFNNNRVRFNAGGSTYIDLNTDQVSLHSSDASANSDVNFFVSGSIGSKDGSEKGTSLFGGDVHISGSLHGIDELVFDSADTKIYRDGAVLKFDDASNDVKTLSQLASTGASTDHFVGVHGSSPATSKLKTTASISFAGALDNFVDGLAADGVGIDTFVFFSGSIGSKDGAERGVTLFGGDSVFSGSATYLGTTAFTSLSATGDVTAGGSFVANGDLIKNSNGDKVLKFSSSTSATLIADSSVIDSTTPSAFLHIENAENVQAATTNETSNFNILLRNSSTQTNAFAGIAFDVSTELDADSIGAAIRGERDTAASTNATLHDTNLTFSTNDAGDSGLTERMRITHDGKVGIGTNNPLESLHISGDLRIDGDDIKDSGGNIVISFDGSGNIDNNVDFTGAVDFENVVNVSQYIQHLSDTDTRLVFNDDQISIEVGGVGFVTFTENLSQDTIVFNEDAQDIDFRIESNLETHMFFVDANTNRIGMGISGPAATLEIKGATADETTLLLRDSNSSDIIAKLYHENAQDDGLLDLYVNGVANTRLHGNGTLSVSSGNLTLNADSGTIDFTVGIESLMQLTDSGITFDDDTVIQATDGNLSFKATGTNHSIIFAVDDAGIDIDPVLTIDGVNNGNLLHTPANSGYFEVNDADTDGFTRIYGQGAINIERYTDTATNSPALSFRRSRGSEGALTSVQSGDRIGNIGFYGHDTIAGAVSAEIRAVASANHGDGGDTSDSPGKLEFYTTPDGTSTSTLAMTINSDQSIDLTGNLTISNGTLIASAASLPGSTLGITVSNPSTAGLYTVTTTEDFISDTSPSTGKARVTFTAPNSGNVEIFYQSGISITDDLSATLYLSLSTNGTTFSTGKIVGTQNVAYDADTGRSGSRVIIHHKWIMTGLTPGSSYTYYIGADASNSTTFDIVWGDNDSDLYYPPLIVEARALPSITTM